MNIAQTTRLGAALRLAAGLGLSAAASAQQVFPDLPLDVVEVTRHPADGPGDLVVLRTAEQFGITPGGVAVDASGNVYLSTTGAPLDNQGTILMLPKGGEKPIRILVGLDNPTDIEISPDQRSLLISLAGGRVQRYYFGVSVRVLNSSDGIRRERLRLQSDRGSSVPDFLADGYFHFPGVLAPIQVSATVNVVVGAANRTEFFADQPLHVLDHGAVGGQTLIELEL